nr:MAG: hypothetical protein DIU78_20205 [Pseudomonadota bacterium]
MMPAEEPPPAPADAAPAEEEETFTLTTGVGFRAALRLQDSENPKKIFGDQWFDELYVEPRFSGRVTKEVGWAANFQASGGTVQGLEVRTLDLYGQLDFADEFHIWAGRLLTPSDRSNFSGPWFMSPWTYPGVYFGGPYIGPRGTEELGRDTGAVVWGDVGEGMFKYYLGVMDLDGNPGDPAPFSQSPLYSARLAYAFIGKEPGFYGSSTYYGSQDIVAIGAAVQYQNDYTIFDEDGMPAVRDDLLEINADILAEFNLGGAGTLTFEGAYYYFDTDAMPMDHHFFVLASYLTPEMIGIGKLQPLVRYQQAMNDDTDQTISQFDVVLSYVMKDYFAKLALAYTHANVSDLGGGTDQNLIQIGFQIQQ